MKIDNRYYFVLKIQKLRDEKRKMKARIQLLEKQLGIQEGQIKLLKHEIQLTSEKPIHVKNYRFPVCHKEEVEKQTADFLERGIIIPSKSPWNAPIWIVSKKQDAS